MAVDVSDERLQEFLALTPPSAPVRFVWPYEILEIHEKVISDFRSSDDPIDPGVRDVGLLASAVARQWTGNSRGLLWSDPIENAATLLYGLCLNHSFVNGNKRTRFVAMLVHLNKNEWVLRGARDSE